MTTTTDTTGTTVLYRDSKAICMVLATDAGQMPNSRPALNVRRMDVTARYTRLSLRDAVVKAIFARTDGYGCSYTSGTLHPVTADDVEALKAADEASEAAKVDQRRLKAEQHRHDYPNPSKAEPCSLCGTYCEGDCTAH